MGASEPNSCRPRRSGWGIAWVETAGDAERLRGWLGGQELPIRVIEGEPGLWRVAVATSGREIVIE